MKLEVDKVERHPFCNLYNISIIVVILVAKAFTKQLHCHYDQGLKKHKEVNLKNLIEKE